MRHHQSRVLKTIHDNDINYCVISTNPRVSNILMLYLPCLPPWRKNRIFPQDTISPFGQVVLNGISSAKHAWRYAKTDASTFPRKTIEITTKHLILCSSINNMWHKTLKTPNKLAGPVGKEGVLGGVNRWRNAGKTTKNNWTCHKMSYFQLGLR